LLGSIARMADDTSVELDGAGPHSRRERADHRRLCHSTSVRVRALLPRTARRVLPQWDAIRGREPCPFTAVSATDTSPRRSPRTPCDRWLSSSKIDHLTHRRAGFQLRKALIDFGELDAARDQMVELEATLFPQRQQPRHVNPKTVAAHRAALELAI